MKQFNVMFMLANIFYVGPYKKSEQYGNNKIHATWKQMKNVIYLYPL